MTAPSTGTIQQIHQKQCETAKTQIPRKNSITSKNLKKTKEKPSLLHLPPLSSPHSTSPGLVDIVQFTTPATGIATALRDRSLSLEPCVLPCLELNQIWYSPKPCKCLQSSKQTFEIKPITFLATWWSRLDDTLLHVHVDLRKFTSGRFNKMACSRPGFPSVWTLRERLSYQILQKT